MDTSLTPFLRTPLQFLCGLVIVALASGDPLQAAAPMPNNLGSGLSNVVARDLAAKKGVVLDVPGTGRAIDIGERAIRDARKRILVTVMLRDKKYVTNVRYSGLISVTGLELKYQGGAMEGYVAPENVAALAKLRGVSSVHLAVRPILGVGATTTHGVVQHRIDKISDQGASPVTGMTGAGIRIGVMSDSFDTSVVDATGAPTMTRAVDDVVTGDLPGPGNPNNVDPVLVLADLAASPTNTDEGRAMCQIVHDIAPAAKIVFATAFGGEVSFANNIRRLAAPLTSAGGACNVIVDDVLNLTEGMFADTIVARAVDEVAAQGISYFSSAGNRPATQGYFSDFRPVLNGTGLTAAAGNTALANTNLDLTGVDPALYAGGFHNFNPNPGQQDVAQTCVLTGTGIWDFQWDDPYDVNPLVIDEDNPIVEGTGTTGPTGTPTEEFVFTFPGTANERVQINVVGSGATPDYDAIVQLDDPDGGTVIVQDTTLEEHVLIFLPKTGTYTVRVREFQTAPPVPAVGGTFDYNVLSATGAPYISTDFNIMFFTEAGAFVSAVGEDNIDTNRPIELAQVSNSQAGNTGRVQVVIARSNIPPVDVPQAKKVRYVTVSNGFPLEYNSYQTPITFGHNSAAGAIGVAAYAFYPPFIPESFCSPGYTYIAFDASNQRLATPQIRLKPDVAAMDGANTTFFPGAIADSVQDSDAFPNFFGTSAAAPHAAAIATLVLQAKGGPTSVTPAQMRIMLQRSAFPHDMDPYLARAVLRNADSRITINASADPGSTTNIISTIDANAFQVYLTGAPTLTQLVFNPQGTTATGGNTTEPTTISPTSSSSPGLVFDQRAPNTGFPFTLGELRGVTAGDISHVLSNPAPAPAVAGQFFTLTINVAPGALIGGDGFNFGMERDEADAFGPFNPPSGAGAVGGNSSDLLGANVLIPQGTIAPGGMTLSATLSDGATLTGNFVNRIGAGYSTLDGFGFINAQSAINQPKPVIPLAARTK